MKLENAGWVNKMVKKLFTVKQAGYEISVEAEQMNCDLIVNLVGGDVPHLGGIVSWDFKTRKQSEMKFANHDGRTHKDIFLLNALLRILKTSFQVLLGYISME